MPWAFGIFVCICSVIFSLLMFEQLLVKRFAVVCAATGLVKSRLYLGHAEYSGLFHETFKKGRGDVITAWFG